jgi:hypothetical protein
LSVWGSRRRRKRYKTEPFMKWRRNGVFVGVGTSIMKGRGDTVREMRAK